jgi:hypothetical protein
MPDFHELRDDFNTGALDTAGRWTQSYGDPDQTAGRARIPCNVGGFAGIRSAGVYTLTGSHIVLRAYPPDANGGVTTAAFSLLILTGTGGTDGGFIIDTAQNAIGLYLREGFADPSPVFLTYSPTGHTWLRFRETGGSLLWETSPDGLAWTVRRTASAPAWTSDTNLSWLMESTRGDGGNNFAGADNVGVPPLTLDPAEESDSAQMLAAAKNSTSGLAAETDGAQPLAGRKSAALAPALEADTAQPLAEATGPLDITIGVGAPYGHWASAVGAPQGSGWTIGAPWI